CTLGTLIALMVSFVINNFGKVSMHATAAGGLLALTILMISRFSTPWFILPLPWLHDLEVPTVYLLYLVILLAGCICTARLIGEKHRPPEVYLGFGVGLVSLWIANLCIG